MTRSPEGHFWIVFSIFAIFVWGCTAPVQTSNTYPNDSSPSSTKPPASQKQTARLSSTPSSESSVTDSPPAGSASLRPNSETQRIEVAQKAVTDFLDAFALLFSTKCNSPEGCQHIANKLELVMTPQLDKRFRDFGIDVINALGQLSSAANSEQLPRDAINSIGNILNGGAPDFAFKSTKKQTSQFASSIESLRAKVLELRLIAAQEFNYNINDKLHYNWDWEDGIFTDDYLLTNKNTSDWEDVEIRVAYISGVSHRLDVSNPFMYKRIAAGDTIRFKDIFTSSEQCDGHLVAFLIKTKQWPEPELRVWICHSKTGTFTGVAKGFVYFWENVPIPDEKKAETLALLFKKPATDRK
jgi:hypothetical protein